jgi:sugar diacid utilization regulator
MSQRTYETLITCRPLFQVEVLAGWAGKKNICQHVFLNELPSETNSFVLLDWYDGVLPLLEEALKDSNCSGVLILSTSSCDMPSAITALANQSKKPLFFLPDNQGEAVYKRINEIFYLLDHRFFHLMKSDLTTYWLELLNGHGMERVMERFCLFLGQEPILLTNNKTFVPFLINTYNAHDFKELETIGPERKQEDLPYAIMGNEKTAFYTFEISQSDDQVQGYLSVEKNHPLEDVSLQLIETILPVIHSWLRQQEAGNQIHLFYKDQFLFDILHNNMTTESELIELGQLRKMEFTPNAFVLSMNLNSQQTITKDIIMNLQQLLVENRVEESHVHTTFLNHQIVAIICPPKGNAEMGKSDWDHWLGNVLQLISKTYPNLQITIGIGRSYASNLNLYKSFHESKIALQLGVNGQDSLRMIHYEELGFVRLLSYIHNDLLKDFSQQYLNRLESYDQQNDTELLHTLMIYCANHGHIPRTAEELYIHPNTLRQRIKKIESLLGMDLNNYTNLVNIILSLQIYQDTNIN